MIKTRVWVPVVTTIVCPYYIDTGMFRGVRTRFPWLLPILEPDDVAPPAVAQLLLQRLALRLQALQTGLDPALLGRWRYEADASLAFTARDRSAIYGGFHIYEKRAA